MNPTPTFLIWGPQVHGGIGNNACRRNYCGGASPVFRRAAITRLSLGGTKSPLPVAVTDLLHLLSRLPFHVASRRLRGTPADFTRMQKGILRGLLFIAVALSAPISSAATLFPPPLEISQKAQAADQPRQAAQPTGPSGPGWISKCVSESRKSPIECSIEESLAIASSGQLVAAVAIKVQPKEREPIRAIKVPAGLYLPAGLNLQVDDGKLQSIPLQTCDAQGCYGEIPVNSNLIAALETGKKLSLTFQNMAKATVLLPFPLDNFAVAFQKIQ
jgi:invasion protein IalB